MPTTRKIGGTFVKYEIVPIYTMVPKKALKFDRKLVHETIPLTAFQVSDPTAKLTHKFALVPNDQRMRAPNLPN